MPTLERRAFVEGLFHELDEQLRRYSGLIDKLFQLEARVQVNERTLKATRDHLLAALNDVGEEVPDNWESVLCRVRFLGMRLADACVEILKERGSVTMEELREELDNGMFRFNTPTPMREINAALLRQQHVRREGDRWVYESPASEEGKEKEPKQIKGKNQAA